MRSEALPDGVTALKAGTRVEFGIAQGRRGDQALQVKVLDAPASVSRNISASKRKKPDEMVEIIETLIRTLDDIGETYRHGRHPDRSTRPTAGEARDRGRAGAVSAERRPVSLRRAREG